MDAIIKALRTAYEYGVNCVLTPDQCHEILSAIEPAEYRQFVCPRCQSYVEAAVGKRSGRAVCPACENDVVAP